MTDDPCLGARLWAVLVRLAAIAHGRGWHAARKRRATPAELDAARNALEPHVREAEAELQELYTIAIGAAVLPLLHTLHEHRLLDRSQISDELIAQLAREAANDALASLHLNKVPLSPGTEVLQ